MTYRSSQEIAHLTIRGLRDVLDDYATNRYHRTDRSFINGWMIACMVYDQLLTDFAAVHQTAVPARHHLSRAWSDADRTRAEQALADTGWPVRPSDTQGRPQPPAIIWGRERLSTRAVALATLVANVAEGALDPDVLTIELRCDAGSIRPDRATGRATAIWHVDSFDVEVGNARVAFVALLTDGLRSLETTGALQLDHDEAWWDLIKCAVAPTRRHEAARAEGQEIQP